MGGIAIEAETWLVAEGLAFPEGPVARPDGSVILVEIEGDSLARIDPEAGVAHLPCGRGPNGAAFGPDGALYVATNGGLRFKSEEGIRFPCDIGEGNVGGAVERFDIETGVSTQVASEVEGRPMGSLNDIVFDRTGRCYVVDTSSGCIYYLDPADGSVSVAADGLEMPNGAGLSPDGNELYVSETFSGLVWAMAVADPGRLAPRRLVHDASGSHGWDGLAVDGEGHICAANLQGSGITVMDPGGVVQGVFTVPLHDPYVTNICFGGVDGRTAFVCSSGRGRLYGLVWPWAGLPLNFAS